MWLICIVFNLFEQAGPDPQLESISNKANGVTPLCTTESFGSFFLVCVRGRAPAAAPPPLEGTGSAGKAAGQAGEGRLGSARLSSARFSSAWLGSARLGSAAAGGPGCRSLLPPPARLLLGLCESRAAELLSCQRVSGCCEERSQQSCWEAPSCEGRVFFLRLPAAPVAGSPARGGCARLRSRCRGSWRRRARRVRA